MASKLSILLKAGCRVDGLMFQNDGTPVFVTTNASGAWTATEQNAVLTALGIQIPAPTTQAQLEAHYSAVTQQWLDSTAQQYSYNNIITACIYTTSSNSLWQRQSQAFVSWRDAVWTSAFQQLAAVEAGTQPLPASDAAWIASLPQPSIPTS